MQRAVRCSAASTGSAAARRRRRGARAAPPRRGTCRFRPRPPAWRPARGGGRRLPEAEQPRQVVLPPDERCARGVARGRELAGDRARADHPPAAGSGSPKPLSLCAPRSSQTKRPPSRACVLGATTTVPGCADGVQPARQVHGLAEDRLLLGGAVADEVARDHDSRSRSPPAPRAAPSPPRAAAAGRRRRPCRGRHGPRARRRPRARAGSRRGRGSRRPCSARSFPRTAARTRHRPPGRSG